MSLSTESIREAIEQYLNRHLVAEHQIKVDRWEIDTQGNAYNASPRIVVTTTPDTPSPSGKCALPGCLLKYPHLHTTTELGVGGNATAASSAVSAGCHGKAAVSDGVPVSPEADALPT
jgi:hypothetical protein